MLLTRHHFILISIALLGFSAPGCLSPKRTPDISSRSSHVEKSQEDQMLRAICGDLTIQSVSNMNDADRVTLPPETGIADPKLACGGCPSDTTFADHLDARYYLGRVWRGGFTATGRDEAWVKMIGCEPHALNFGNSYLLRKTGMVWMKQIIEKGETAKNCIQYASPEGQDRLLCESEWAGQGVRTLALAAWKFDETRAYRQELLRYGDNLGAESHPDGWLFDVRRLAWRSKPRKNDPRPRIEAEFSVRAKLLDPDMRDQFMDHPSEFLPEKPERMRLRWVETGGKLVLEPNSQKTADRIRQIMVTSDQ